MPTYRCLSCRGVYVNPQKMVEVPHVCPPDRVVDDKGTRKPIEDPRDERLEQDETTGLVHIRKRGKGRELLSLDDLVSELAPEDVAALQARPAIGPSPEPEKEYKPPEVWPQRGGKR